jgi:hypothetical protein
MVSPFSLNTKSLDEIVAKVITTGRQTVNRLNRQRLIQTQEGKHLVAFKDQSEHETKKKRLENGHGPLQ